ncbi:Hint domain-containing protein [Pseudomonas sp.]|uniref:Hint domain-containing protein n=1 Tax=Pseudomonas sp. TaxID=306 RepID=UPI0028A91651|nr:Hint domain-containing protein [Pseudomonas sp.]
MVTGRISGRKPVGGHKSVSADGPKKTSEASKGTEDVAANRPADRAPCCFAAGTKVSTPDGDRVIESLKVGDVVWTKPEHGGKPFAAKILATHQRSDQPIYRLKLKSVRSDGGASGETLLVTPSHPFYVPAQRDFVSVIDLKPGDRLQSLADGESEDSSSEVESLELYLPEGKTYNLTVDVGHTFYVGELKTWVHNEGPCDNQKTGGSDKAPPIKHSSGVELPRSQSQMIANFEAAGYPSKPVVSPTSGNVVGTQYIMPDGSRVRVMKADGKNSQRASFENANGGPIDPTTGKPPQPPKGLSNNERKQWVRTKTHIEQVE